MFVAVEMVMLICCQKEGSTPICPEREESGSNIQREGLTLLLDVRELLQPGEDD